MGYSTRDIDKDDALYMAKDGKVICASDESYFNCSYWRDRVVSAEIRDDNKVIIFDLFNGDFVEYEIK